MKYRVLPLEERVLLDAAAVVDMADEFIDDSNGDPFDFFDIEMDGDEGLTELDFSANPSGEINLLIVSSDVTDIQGLADASIASHLIIYDPKTTSLQQLLEKVHETLKGKLADSIGFVNHGNSGVFRLTEGNIVNLESIHNDSELRGFWGDLGESVNVEGRIDLLSCNLAGIQKGLELLQEIEELSGVEVAASVDITGNSGDWYLEVGDIQLTEMYFDESQLLEWKGEALPNSLITGKVWVDSDNDGIFDGVESAGRDLLVTLYSSASGVLTEYASTMTDVGGNYAFLVDGNLDMVVEIMPNPGNTFYDQFVTDVDVATGKSDLFVIESANPSTVTVNGRIVDLGTEISGFAWIDTNEDGVFGGESTLNGIKVQLFDDMDQLLTTRTTGETGVGDYTFDNFSPGDYTVKFLSNVGATYYRFTTPGVDSDVDIYGKKDVTVVLSSVSGVDAGLILNTLLEVVVWEETNYNGIRDVGELEFSGLTPLLDGNLVSHTSPTAGTFIFKGLTPGSYDLTFKYLGSVLPHSSKIYTLQDEGSDEALDSDFDPATGVFQVDLTTEAHVTAGIAEEFTFGDFVWIDEDKDGVQDVGEVGLEDMDISVYLSLDDRLIDSTTSDVNGAYQFELPPSDYYLIATLPTPPTFEYKFTPQDQGSNDAKDSDVDPSTGRYDFTMTAADDLDIDMGVIQIQDVIGYVRIDDNQDDSLATSETNVLEGISVDLYQGMTLLTSTTTDASGFYEFQDLEKGDYRLEFGKEDSSGDFYHYITGGESQIDANGEHTITGLNQDTTVIAGLAINRIQVFAWSDATRDGIFGFDAIESQTEEVLEGVTVELKDGTTVLATLNTDALGVVVFEGFENGTYTLEASHTVDWTFTSQDQGSDETKDSDFNASTHEFTLTNYENEALDVGVGLYDVYFIGNFVWEDLNGDGIQDAGEPGLEDVVVNVYDNLTDTLVGSATTDALGFYQVERLSPFTNYYVIVDLSNLPSPNYEYIFSPALQGGDTTKDSNVDEITGRYDFSLAAVDDFTIDAAAYTVFDIDGIAWNDAYVDFRLAQANGIFDTGEVGVKDISFELYHFNTVTSVFDLVDSITSASDGTYKFENFIAGDYKVRAILPNDFVFTDQDVGSDDTIDSDFSLPSQQDAIQEGDTGTIVLSKVAGDITDVDVGLLEAYSVGNLLWEDEDGDGLQEASETNTLQTALIELVYEDDSSTAFSANPDVNGNYLFRNVLKSNYFLKVTLPADYGFTIQDRDSDDTIDQEINQDTGESDHFFLDATTSDLDIGVGHLYTMQLLSWEDANEDGLFQLTSESIRNNQFIELKRTYDNKLMGSAFTFGGFVSFDEIVVGDYFFSTGISSNRSITLKDQVSVTGELSSNFGESPGSFGTIAVTDNTELRTSDILLGGGFIIASSIEGNVWADLSANGVKESGEENLVGVTVNLYEAGGTIPILTTITDANGDYIFSSISLGDYFVEVVPPTAKYVLSPNDQGSDDAIDSDFDLATQRTGTWTLTEPGLVNVDAGFTLDYTVSGEIWVDTDEDGIRDPGESLIAETVSLQIVSVEEGSTFSTTTSTGAYSFSGVGWGNHTVRVTPPVGFLLSSHNQGGDDTLDSDFNSLGISDSFNIDPAVLGLSDVDVDAGMIDAQVIEGRVWLEQQINNLYDSGVDTNLIGIVIQLLDTSDNVLATTVTDPNGDYNFTVSNGNYRLRAQLPGIYQAVTKDVGGNDNVDSDFDPNTRKTDTIVVAGDGTYDFDLGLRRLINIGNFAWNDRNLDGIYQFEEPPLAGVIVELYDSTGTILQASDTTDLSGAYSFTNIPNDAYILRINLSNFPGATLTQVVTDPSDSAFNSDFNPTTLELSLDLTTATGDRLDIDVGVLPVFSIESRIWYDANSNSIQDATPDTDLQGVIVNLYQSEALIGQTTTNAQGIYKFDNLTIGSGFHVEFVIPTGYSLVDFQIGGDTANDNDFILSSTDPTIGEGSTFDVSDESQGDIQLDGGVKTVHTISGVAWKDSNQDGVIGGLEDDFPGISVRLYRDDGMLISQTTTDLEGRYTFEGVFSGSYYVEVDRPDGYTFSLFAADNKVSEFSRDIGRTNVFAVSGVGVDVLSENIGLRSALSIGNRAWYDLDGNNFQSSSDLPLENVTFRLYNSIGQLIDTQLSDASGEYLFFDVAAGTYFVEADLPAGNAFVMPHIGGDLTTDSDFTSSLGTPSIAKTELFSVTGEGDFNHDLDVGFRSIHSFTERVYHDVDADGVSDPGEAGISGVTVRLYNDEGALVAQSVTNGSGEFTFANILNDRYRVVLDNIPSDFAVASNLLDQTGSTELIFLQQVGQEESSSIGLRSLHTIVSQIWHDLNGNGVRLGEPLLSDATVHLFDTNDEKIATQVSDGSGEVTFTDVLNGEYYLQLELPTGFTATTAGVSPNNLNSDFEVLAENILLANSGAISLLTPGQNESDVDAGLIVQHNLRAQVWYDANGNAVQDEGEEGLSAIDVGLYNGIGTLILQKQTDGNGFFQFNNVAVGSYHLAVISPLLQGQTASFTLNNSGFYSLDIDIGTRSLHEVEGTAWLDRDPNEVRNFLLGFGQEEAFAGLLITLLDEGGNTAGFTTTDAQGRYSFTNVLNGEYQLFVSNPPAGYLLTATEFDPITHKTDFFSLNTVGERIQRDLDLHFPSKIEGFAWVDNNNNILDTGEVRLEGVRFKLFNSAGVLIQSTETDASGYYTFENLLFDQYLVEVERAQGYEFLLKNSVFIVAPVSDVVEYGTDFSLARSKNLDLTLNPATFILNARFDPYRTIGDFIWYDTGNNGIQDGSDTPFEGLTVNLLDSGLNILQTQLTGADGGYLFTDLDEGLYAIQVIEPVDYDFITSPIGSDTNLDSTSVDASGRSGLINLIGSNLTELGIDFGLTTLHTVTEHIYYDADGNFTQNGSEAGIFGVTASLLDVEGNVIQTTTTDNNGIYTFSNVVAGRYQVGFSALPSNYTFEGSTIPSETTPLFSLTEIGATNPQFNSSLRTLHQIGNFIWDDTNNPNGIQESGEVGVELVQLELRSATGDLLQTTQTDSNGFYEFTNILNSTYSLVIHLPYGFILTTPLQGGDINLDSNFTPDPSNNNLGLTGNLIFQGASNDFLNIDAGLVKESTIGDLVWLDLDGNGVQNQDENEVGIANVSVSLHHASTDALISSTTTDVSGLYSFRGVAAGDYYVKVNLPGGYVFTAPYIGADQKIDSNISVITPADGFGVTENFTVTGPEFLNVDLDAGLIPLTSIEDFVWYDADGDQLKGAGEVGVSGISITLYDENGALVGRAASDATGFYEFTDIVSGQYQVRVDLVPPEFTLEGTTIEPLTGLSTLFTVNPQIADPFPGIGLRSFNTMGNFVWLDSNNNGLQDPSEVGIEGFTVRLLDRAGSALIAETTTDASGFYQFDQVLNGIYTLGGDLPVGFGFTVTHAGINPSLDNHMFEVVEGVGLTHPVLLSGTGVSATDLTVDIGLRLAPTIGGTVWDDLNADGLFDSSESVISKIPVHLFDTTGRLLRSIETDSSGFYSFKDLISGDYYLELEIPSSREMTALFEGSDPEVDSNFEQITSTTARTGTITVPLTAGYFDFSFDAGMLSREVVSGTIWYDANFNGVNDDTSPLAGLTVELIDSLGAVVGASTTTDANGGYSFGGIVNGIYKIQITGLPAGYTLEQTGLDPTGLSASFQVARTADNGLDVGIRSIHAIGEFVWYDANEDGIQNDGASSGFGGITVFLHDGATDAVLDQIVTLSSGSVGFYAFNNLVNGTYYITADLPVGYAFTLPEVGDATLDSNILSSNRTADIVFNSFGVIDPSVDIGLKSNRTIGDFIWHDLNLNGLQDPGEPGVAGVTVKLFEDLGTQVGSDIVTGEDGYYLFTGLPADQYFVQISLPTGYRIITPSSESIFTGGALVGLSPTIDLTTVNAVDLGVDAGLSTVFDWTGSIWYDRDHDQQKDGGEPTFENVRVGLHDPQGFEQFFDLTDSNGDYSFSDIPQGTYSIHLTNLPVGYSLRETGFDPTGVSPLFTLSDLSDEVSPKNVPLRTEHTLSGVAWIDENMDGIIDLLEPLVAAQSVSIYTEAGLLLNTVTTGALGEYQFEDLLNNGYEIKIDQLEGYSFTQLANDNNFVLDPNGVGLGTTNSFELNDVTGVTLGTFNAGFKEAISFGNFVWLDSNANGLQDAGEVGVEGVRIDLFTSVGAFIGFETTNGSGFYQFNNLSAGDYYIEALLPAGHEFTDVQQGPDRTLDSDINPVLSRSVDFTLAASLSFRGDIDVGLRTLHSITNSVWYDKDGDELFDTEESPFSGVLVELYNASGVKVDQTLTDASGNYQFNDQRNGLYFIKIPTIPIGYSFKGSALDEVTGESELFSIEDAGINVGLRTLHTIGDFVWEDTNGDGFQDGSEQGVSGTVLNLRDTASGDLVETTISAANGSYSFVDVPSGIYFIEVERPQDFGFSPQHAIANVDKDSDFAASIVNPNLARSIDFALNGIGFNIDNFDLGLIPTYSIGDRVWHDFDGDLIQDPNEPGEPGVTVNLYNSLGSLSRSVETGENGSYLFYDLLPGDYQVQITDIPSDKTLEGSGYDPITGFGSPLTIISNDVLSEDIGLRSRLDVTGIIWYETLLDGVFEPGTESGIQNVGVNLYNDSGALQGTTFTNLQGEYAFNNILNDEFYIEVFQLPTGYTLEGSTLDSITGYSDLFSMGSVSDTSVTQNGGLRTLHDVGDRVWYDADGDGIQDVGETGINGVVVELFSSEGVSQGTQTTSGDGNYLFEDLLNGEYYLELDIGTLPAGYQVDGGNAALLLGSDNSFVVQGAEINLLDRDVSLRTLHTLGDEVVYDRDGDGVQDVSDPGVSGVEVSLFNGSGTLISQTTTDGIGHYEFTVLNNEYYIELTGLPSGFTLLGGNAPSVTGAANSVVLQGIGNNQLDLDVLVRTEHSIGDRIWYDLDGDGTQDVGEVGLNGAVMELFSIGGTSLGTQTTSGDGDYLFTNLLNGEYYLEVVSIPAGYTLQGGNVISITGIGNAFVVQDPLVNALDKDISVRTLHGIGDRIWYDVDGDGIQDVGELGVNGVVIELFSISATSLGTQTTSSDGDYLFTSVLNGEYYLEIVSIPTGYTLQGSNGANILGVSNSFLIQGIGTSLLDRDIGLRTLHAIGDEVIYDRNGDGVRDPGDPGVAGFDVSLFNDLGALIAQDTTDVEGFYSFTGLLNGEYYIEIAGISPGFTLLGGNAASITGVANSVTVEGAGVDRLDLDLLVRSEHSIGDRVWYDVDGDGIQDAGETGLNGAVIELFSIGDVSQGTQTTSGDGNYLFTSVLNGEYYLEIVSIPVGYTLQGGTAASIAGISNSFLIQDPLVNTLDKDISIRTSHSVGDRIWYDVNGDGIQDIGEVGVNSAVIELFSIGGISQGTQITSGDGNYLFTSVLNGEYYLEIVSIPTGYTLQGSNGANILGVSNSFLIQGTGVSLIDRDIGLRTQHTIGDEVIYDQNGDGVRDPGDPGAFGVEVSLFNSLGDLMDQTTTDGNGLYGFTDLLNGEYYIEVTGLPLGFTLLGGNATSITGAANSILLEGVGDNRSNLDVLVRTLHNVGDRIWHDLDGGGIQDVGEAGVNGAVIELFSIGGISQGTQTTLADGNYLFTSVLNGEYYLEIVSIPAEFVLSGANAASLLGVSNSFALQGVGIDLLDRDIGLRSEGRVGDRVWYDLDGDGIQDVGESGVNGAVIELFSIGGVSQGTQTTSGDGNYLFTSVLNGEYYLEILSIPVGYTQQGSTSVSILGVGNSFILSGAGASLLDLDIGVRTLHSVGDRIWYDINGDGIQDVGEAGIDGVEIEFFLMSGDSQGTQTSSGGGDYLFTDLLNGEYYLEIVSVPTGYTQQGSTSASILGISNSFVLQGALNNLLDRDIGLRTLHSIGDRVWHDVSADGIQDFGELGVVGVEVSLFRSDGGLVDSTLTIADGFYQFTDLINGEYYIEITSVPSGFSLVGGNASSITGVSNAVTLEGIGIDRLDLDVSLSQLQPISGSVWKDLNLDGIMDLGEGGVAGVTLRLFDASSILISTVTTDLLGDYSFAPVEVGSGYFILVDPMTTPGYGFSIPGVDNDADSTGKIGPFTVGATPLSFDTGVQFGVTIGDRVWNDINGDGLQDIGEGGIPGLTVHLHNATSGDILSSTLTGIDGIYGFDNIVFGDYYVSVDLPSGAMFSPSFQGTDPTLDSNVDITGKSDDFTVSYGTDRFDIDAGIIPLYQITGLVWGDVNENGIFETGELGLANLEVSLFNSVGQLLNTTNTDFNGEYTFDVIDGSYYVIVEQLSGTLFSPKDQGGDETLDSDVNAMGQTDLILINGQDIDDIDAGVFELDRVISGTVWDDLNVDGIFDFGEAVIAGITVELYNATTGMLVDTAVTDIQGDYLFGGIASGFYYVVIQNSSYLSTHQDQGSDDSVDSDINLNGRGPTLDLTAPSVYDIDAGLVAPASVTGRVWEDLDGDGIQDPLELSLSDIVVKLYRADGTFVQATQTDTNGIYRFDGIDPKNEYLINVEAPEGREFTLSNQGLDDTVDSDVASPIPLGGLQSGEVRGNLDGGLLPEQEIQFVIDVLKKDQEEFGKDREDEPISIKLITDVDFKSKKLEEGIDPQFVNLERDSALERVLKYFKDVGSNLGLF